MLLVLLTGLPAFAENLYEDDFESSTAGTFPARWQARGPYWAGSELYAVEEVEGRGQALALKGRYFHHLDLDLPDRLDHGTLRLRFDVRLAEDHDKLWFTVTVDDERPPVDVDAGWERPREFASYLWFHDRENGPALYAVAWDRKQTRLKGLEPQRWYTVEAVLDLAERKYDVSVDGEIVASDVPFRDVRWFLGANHVVLRGGKVLLDDFSVTYVPGDPATARLPSALAVRPRSVPAHRLDRDPKIDGTLGDGEWADAWRTGTFYASGGDAAKTEAQMMLGFRGDWLYLAVRDDAPRDLRVRIDPSGSRYGRHLWFETNADGDRRHGTSDGQRFDPPWRVATARDGDTWTVECAIPLSRCARVYWSAAAWAFNVTLSGGGREPVMLCPDGGEPDNTIRFAMLAGVDAVNTSRVRCRIERSRPPHTGRHVVRAELWNECDEEVGPFVPSLAISRPDGKHPVIDLEPMRLGAGERKALGFDLDLDRRGGYQFQLSAWQPGVETKQRTRDAQFGVSRPRFVEVFEPGVLRLLADRNYYTTESVARILGRIAGVDLSSGSAARVTVRHGDEVLVQNRQPIKSAPFVVSVDLDRLPLATSEVIVEVLDAGGAQVATAKTALVRRAPRREEVKIRWDNVVLIGGRPYFPVFLWSGDMVKIMSLGGNTALIGSFSLPLDRYEQAFQLAKSRGLKIIYWAAHPWENPDEALPKIDTVRDHPSFMGWLVEDEPKPLPHSEPVRELRDRIAAHDPYRPTMLTYVASWGRIYRDGLVTADMVGMNAYASYWHYDSEGVSKSVRTLNVNIDDGRAVLTTLQAWHSQANRAHPTTSEFRHSVWSAIVEGSTGIGFWGNDLRNGFGGEDIRGLQSDPVLWREVARTARVVRRLAPVLTSEQLTRPEASVDNELVHLRTWRHDGATWVLLVNMRGGPENVTLTLPGSSGRLVNELEPGGEWVMDGERCSFRLGPLQAMMMRNF
ncbi:MAG: hypothetical protein CMJ18_19270 [Phycisphaeraceae bacterium]|nr:hypothetical protein [Phycisphaeraceae bacterium]